MFVWVKTISIRLRCPRPQFEYLTASLNYNIYELVYNFYTL